MMNRNNWSFHIHHHNDTTYLWLGARELITVEKPSDLKIESEGGKIPDDRLTDQDIKKIITTVYPRLDTPKATLSFMSNPLTTVISLCMISVTITLLIFTIAGPPLFADAINKDLVIESIDLQPNEIASCGSSAGIDVNYEQDINNVINNAKIATKRLNDTVDKFRKLHGSEKLSTTTNKTTSYPFGYDE